MPKKEDVFALIRAGLHHKDDELREITKRILEEEKAHNRMANVTYLERLLNTPAARYLEEIKGNSGYFTSAINENMVQDFCYKKEPIKTLEDIQLSDMNRKTIAEVLEEQKQAEILLAHGLAPRHRLLFKGPPGNGKTCLAEAIANAMNLPFLVVRQEGLIDSHLGKTARNIYQVFSYAIKQPCVLFFDEFDAIGGRRSNSSTDTNEFNRVVNAFLTQLDALPYYVLVIAATNRADILDEALLRRFQITLEFKPANKEGRTKYIQWYMNTHRDITFTQNASYIAELSGPCSYSELEELIISIHRKLVLNQMQDCPKNYIDEINAWKKMHAKL